MLSRSDGTRATGPPGYVDLLMVGDREALQEYCSTRPSMAARLRTLPARIDAIQVTPDLVRNALRSHGEDPSVLVSPAGDFDFAGERVRVFLGIAESRCVVRLALELTNAITAVNRVIACTAKGDVDAVARVAL